MSIKYNRTGIYETMSCEAGMAASERGEAISSGDKKWPVYENIILLPSCILHAE